MSVVEIVLGSIQMLLSVVLIVMVLFQHGKQQGLSGSIAGGAETFFGKKKGRTIDEKLVKWTAVAAIAFVVITMTLCFIELANSRG